MFFHLNRIVEDHPDMTREQVHDELDRLQSEDKLILQVVNDRHLEPRAGEMIEHPHRGLLGYIQPRGELLARGKELSKPKPPSGPPIQKQDAMPHLRELFNNALSKSFTADSTRDEVNRLSSIQTVDLRSIAKEFGAYVKPGTPKAETLKAIADRIIERRADHDRARG